MPRNRSIHPFPSIRLGSLWASLPKSNSIGFAPQRQDLLFSIQLKQAYLDLDKAWLRARSRSADAVLSLTRKVTADLRMSKVMLDDHNSGYNLTSGGNTLRITPSPEDQHWPELLARSYEPARAAVYSQADDSAQSLRLDTTALADSWRNMPPVHSAATLANRYGLSLQSLFTQLQERQWTCSVCTGSAFRLLELMADTQLPAIISYDGGFWQQEYRGHIDNVQHQSGQLHIDDPNLKVHLSERRISSTWVIQRPSTGGWQRTVEFLDTKGASLLSLSCAAAQGSGDDVAWQAITDVLSSEDESPTRTVDRLYAHQG